MGIAFIFGFISGFVLLISGNTLNFWLAESGVDITAIGLFSLISLPYAINFFWAPLLDKIRLPYLATIFGHRLSWIYCLQILLAISVYILSIITLQLGLITFAFSAFIVAFLSSTQDSAIGALRTELLSAEKQKTTAGVYIFGYRIGMLFSSSGAIFLSTILSWKQVYQIFAAIILCFPFFTHFACQKYPIQKIEKHLKFLSFADLSKQFGNRRFLVCALLFLILYRMPDNFINVMINPFLLSLGYKALEIASVGKFLGVIAAIIGGFIASFIMHKKSLYNSLIIFGIIHAFAHSMFIVQEAVGYNLMLLFIVMGFESITGGMTMAAYMAFIGSLCNGPYRATKYAFFTSMMGLSRSILPGLAGFIVQKYGWSMFYLFTSVAAVPSIILLRYVQSKQSSL